MMESLLDRIGLAFPEEGESDEARAKRERIEFHRLHVRNGPRSMAVRSAGRVARLENQRHRRQARKQRLSNRRAWIDNRFAIMKLRGRLEALGLVERANEGVKRRSAGADTRAIIRSLREQHGTVRQALATYERVSG